MVDRWNEFQVNLDVDFSFCAVGTDYNLIHQRVDRFFAGDSFFQYGNDIFFQQVKVFGKLLGGQFFLLSFLYLST